MKINETMKGKYNEIILKEKRKKDYKKEETK
jgi:hypothetical protein